MNESLTIVIDPGHGGRDPGAVHHNDQEKDFTLDIGLTLSQELEQAGIMAPMTRTTDIDLTPNERTNLVKQSGATLCLSIHVNAGGGEGAETIYSIHDKPTLASSLLEAICYPALFTKRRAYQRESTRFVGQDYYYIIRDTRPISTVIIEYGFIDNQKDLKKLKNESFRHVLAQRTAKAVMAFLKGDTVSISTAQQAQANLIALSGKVVPIPNEKQRLIDGRFFLEGRYVSEILGGKIDWDENNKIATFDFSNM